MKNSVKLSFSLDKDVVVALNDYAKRHRISNRSFLVNKILAAALMKQEANQHIETPHAEAISESFSEYEKEAMFTSLFEVVGHLRILNYDSAADAKQFAIACYNNLYEEEE